MSYIHDLENTPGFSVDQLSNFQQLVYYDCYKRSIPAYIAKQQKTQAINDYIFYPAVFISLITGFFILIDKGRGSIYPNRYIGLMCLAISSASYEYGFAS